MKTKYRLESRIAGKLPSGKPWSWRYVPEHADLPVKKAIKMRDENRAKFPTMRFRVIKTKQTVVR